MEKIKLFIEGKLYKDAYKYIIKNFKKEDYINYFSEIKEIFFGFISIYESSKALRLFRKQNMFRG